MNRPEHAFQARAVMETIDPPSEHAAHPYHWAYCCRSPGGFLVFEARNGRLWDSLGHTLNAEALYEKGWRYLAPAIPPTVGVKQS